MSRAADALRLSGIAGLTLGAIYGNYQEALRSPMTMGGSQASPEWMVATHVHLLGLSLVYLVFSFVIDDAFEGYRNLTAGLGIVAQWIEPLSITFVAGLGIGIFGLFGQFAAALNLYVIAAFLINYVRHGWGTAGE